MARQFILAWKTVRLSQLVWEKLRRCSPGRNFRYDLRYGQRFCRARAS